MKNKRAFSRIAALLMALCLVAGCLGACGGKEITVTVNDMGTKTEVTSAVGKTVAQVLETAQIALGEKDETEPAADTKLTEDITEITVKRYAKVTVVYGGETKEVELVGGTVEDAVKAAAFQLEDGVTADTEGTTLLKNGMTINLVKGMKITLTADGKTVDVTTKAADVKSFLEEQKITMGKDDEVSEKLDTKLTDGMKIVVKRVEYKEEKKTETVDYKTEERYSDSMASGTSEVTQNGVEGEKEVTYKVKYVDGKEDSREVVSEKVTKEAVNQIVTYGSASGGSDTPDDSGSGNNGGSNEVTIISKQAVPDCDGSGHGYYIITYSDGTVVNEDY